MSAFEAGLDGVTFRSNGCKLLGGFYKARGDSPRPAAVLIHGLPGIEKHLDIAYALRDLGWNCLYFHFRGCWGSEGVYSLAGLAEDTGEAVAWLRNQPSVDQDRIVLIGCSTGSYPALLHGATDRGICAIAGISPLIEPRAFQFPDDMAGEFAAMLNGVTARDLREQWDLLPPLSDSMRAFAPRPVLLITADQDTLFPPSHYQDALAGFPDIEWIRNKDGDHGFSTCRTWLVQTVTDWLVARAGA